MLCLLLYGSFTLARGQAISAPNQVTGTIKWTNDPAGPVYPYLSAAGFGYASINAAQSGGGFNASTTALPANQGDIAMPYIITVQAGDPPGIRYDLGVSLSLTTGDNYIFQSVTTDPVLKEPAPDVTTNFCECAGLIEVQFCDTNGNPVTVSTADLNAYILPLVSGAGPQADGGILANVSSRHLLVRGGNDFSVEAIISQTITSGTDPYFDLITFTISYTTNYTVTVGCDEIVIVKFSVPPSPIGPGGGGDLGEIIGLVDMVGKYPHWIHPGGGTVVIAENGLFGNYRYDTVEPACFPGCVSPLVGTPTDNSAGAFLLPKLLRSSFLGINQDYEVWVWMNFGLGRRYQAFSSPRLIGTLNNPKVPVAPGATVNLGDTFVMKPGYVVGDIYLCVPPEGTNFQSALHSLIRPDYDVNGDGIPEDLDLSGYFGSSHVSAGGLDVLAPGASTTAINGGAAASFEGEIATSGPDKGSFVGDYELALAGLKGNRTFWNPGYLTLLFENGATPAIPDSYIHNRVGILNNHFANVEIIPATTITNHHRYGFSQVTISFHTTSGLLFDPVVGGSGSFNGVNFDGDSADYDVTISAVGRYNGAGGTPISLATAATDGQVVMFIPEATYTFNPSLELTADGINSSHNTLRAFELVVLPCVNITATPEIQMTITNLPHCVTNRLLDVSGSIVSVTNVASISYELNGGASGTVCNNCGMSPPLSFSVLLADCENTLKVTATDVNGRIASVESTITHDVTPPILSGCQNLATNALAGTNGNFVSYPLHSAVDDCDGPLPVTCVPPPGSFFTNGQTVVTCTAVDHCGNTNTCQFTVTVGSSTNCCDECFPRYPASYTVTVHPGDNYLVNHLCHGTSNLLNEVLPVVPDGTVLFKWNIALQLFDSPSTYLAGMGWLDSSFNPSTETLPPGVGFVLSNPGAAFDLTLEGCEPTCPPPCAPTNGCWFVGRIGIGPATWANLFSCPPVCGTQVRVWNPSNQVPSAYDYVNDTWTPSEPVLAIGESAFVCRLENTNCAGCDPPQVTVQPQSQTIPECSCVTFTVTAVGGSPLTYHWQRNNVDIPAAIGSSYTVCPVSLADDGSVFRVIISNPCGMVASADATLTVTPDVTPPQIVSGTHSCCDDRLYVLFDERVDAASAQEVLNYSLSSGAVINDATLLPDGRTVCLSTDPLAPGQTDTLTVGGVQDCAGNILSPDPSQVAFTVPVFTKGYVLREWWFDVPGNSLTDLTSLPTYPLSPDRECYTNLFELNSASEADSYGARISGWFCPPESGDYRFYLAADGQAELYLSTDASCANQALIAAEPSLAGRREWMGNAGGNRPNLENVSSLVPLVEGQRYYIEALMKEDSGADHLGVAVQMPGDPPPVSGSTPILGEYLGVCLAATGSVSILQQPADVTVSACGNEVCFTVSAMGGGGCGLALSYQWQRNGVDIAGATGSTFCLTNVTLADDGTQFRVVVTRGASSIISQVATLTVIADTAPPVLISTSVDCWSGKITLVFNECLDLTAAQDASTYSISGGVTIMSTELLADGKTVCLFTSPLSADTDYTITAVGLLDLCANPAAEQTVTVRCPCELPICALDDVWRYEESGTDLGTAWSAPGYDDSAWPQGPGLLGLESFTTSPPILTPLSVSSNKVTFYFRKHFNFAGNPAGGQLRLDTRIDDGAVFYLNGVEIHRVRMPAAPAVISAATLATGSAPEPGSDVFVVNAPSLVTGVNVLAVEVHQVSANSSDIIFGAAFSALVADTTPPTLNCPTSDLVIQVTDSGSAVVSYPVTATDDVDPSVLIECVPPDGAVFPCGTNQVTCIATDACGNQTNCAFRVIVECLCLNVLNERLTCASNAPGKLDYSFTLRNNTGVPVQYLYLVLKTNCFTATPDIFTFRPPLLPGQTANVSARINLTGNCPPRLCFLLAAHDSSLVQCCSISHCVDRPSCSVPPPIQLFINEWLADNTHGLVDPADGQHDDWFEIYNPGTNAVSLAGNYLTDDLDDPFKFSIPPGYVVSPAGCLLVWADDQPQQNTHTSPDLHVNFTLSSGGGDLGLFVADGTLIDVIRFGPQTSDVSEGRWPDGGTNCYFLSHTTPRAPNVLAPRLNLTLAGGQLCFSWIGEAILEGAISLMPPIHWMPTADQSNPQCVLPAGRQKFFRLRSNLR